MDVGQVTEVREGHKAKVYRFLRPPIYQILLISLWWSSLWYYHWFPFLWWSMYELVCNDLASKQSLFALVIQPRHGCQTLNNFNLEKQPHRTSIISTGSYIAVYSLLVKKINKRYKSSWSEQLLLEHPCKEFRTHRTCQHLIKNSTARGIF